MQRKEGLNVRPKSTMLEKAIRELEKMAAESRPPTMEVQDADISSQAVKRRLPHEVKQKLAKVARLAQANHGKISMDLVNRLMSIVGHMVQLRTLKLEVACCCCVCCCEFWGTKNNTKISTKISMKNSSAAPKNSTKISSAVATISSNNNTQQLCYTRQQVTATTTPFCSSNKGLPVVAVGLGLSTYDKASLMKLEDLCNLRSCCSSSDSVTRL